jgi:hypothetical protein
VKDEDRREGELILFLEKRWVVHRYSPNLKSGSSEEREKKNRESGTDLKASLVRENVDTAWIV